MIVIVRMYRPEDRSAVVDLAPRLTVGVAPWRDPELVASATRRWVVTSVDRADAEWSAVFVAEDDDGTVVGFVSVGSRAHWSGETDAYVGELVVAERVERRGVGSALMDAAERWGRQHGFSRLTLETGAANTVAREFYRSRGYRDEDVRLSVELPSLPIGP